MALKSKLTYYVGYDPGTGGSSMSVTPVTEDGKKLPTRRLTIPSLYGMVNFSKLVNDRSLRTTATLASVLKKEEQEIAVGYNQKEYGVGPLAALAGVNATNAKNAEKRYTDIYSRIVFLGMFGYLTDEDDIDDTDVEARIVTGLPMSLFVKKTRDGVRKNLEGLHPFTWNGKPRRVNAFVGTVTREGIKALATYGDEESRQAVVDIGTRTINVGQTIGQKVLPEFCNANTLGIGKVHDGLIGTLKTEHRISISMKEADEITRAYVAERPLPTVLKGNSALPERDIRDIVAKYHENEWTAIDLFIDQSWNEEGTDVGSNLRKIVCIGGGSKVWGKKLTAKFPQAFVPQQSEEEAILANVEAYLNLSLDLNDIDPTIWKL